MASRSAREHRAFTLIELLIVVAIIAILSAIAVPNFMEAQIRAKIVRVKNDMRVIANAIEAYFIDYNSYPNDSDNNLLYPECPGQNGLLRLTTPIAYLPELPMDPFQNTFAGGAYELGSGVDHQGWGNEYGPQTDDPDERALQTWLLISAGVDESNFSAEDDTERNDQWPWGTRCYTYDPTNGSRSNGDIYLVGGSYRSGRYYVNDVKYGQFPSQ